MLTRVKFRKVSTNGLIRAASIRPHNFFELFHDRSPLFFFKMIFRFGNRSRIVSGIFYTFDLNCFTTRIGYYSVPVSYMTIIFTIFQPFQEIRDKVHRICQSIQLPCSFLNECICKLLTTNQWLAKGVDFHCVSFFEVHAPVPSSRKNSQSTSKGMTANPQMIQLPNGVIKAPQTFFKAQDSITKSTMDPPHGRRCPPSPWMRCVAGVDIPHPIYRIKSRPAKCQYAALTNICIALILPIIEESPQIAKTFINDFVLEPLDAFTRTKNFICPQIKIATFF